MILGPIMAIYAGILVVVMMMIKLIPLVTLGDTWAQVYTHRPSQPAAPYLLLSLLLLYLLPTLPTFPQPTYYLDAYTER